MLEVQPVQDVTDVWDAADEQSDQGEVMSQLCVPPVIDVFLIASLTQHDTGTVPELCY